MSYSGIERRRWPRVPAEALGNLSAAIVPGPDGVKVVDLSRGGALLEVAARFPLMSSVRLKLTQPGGETILAEGRVARARVAALVNGVINYRFAVIFERPIAGLTPEGIDARPDGAGATPHDQAGPVAAAAGAPRAVNTSGEATTAASTASRATAERTLAIVPARAATVPGAGEVSDPGAALRAELARERSRLEKELAAATADLARLSTANQALMAKLEESDGRRTALHNELEAERRRLENELAAATADLARQSTASQALLAKLEESDERRTVLRDELEAERRQWEEERSTLLQQVADAVAVADTLHGAQKALEQRQAEGLAEQRDRYEALLAELVTSTNEQQTEYQQLVEHLTASGDEQRRRADHLDAEIARERAVAHQDQTEAETRFREVEARLEAAEALCAAHDARNQAVRGQLEQLVSLVATPLVGEAPQSHESPSAGETEPRTRAIA